MKRSYAAGLSFSAVALAVIVWGQAIKWHIDGLSTYRWFPLFGLLAYSLLWSTYMVGWGRRLFGQKENLADYYKIVRLFIIVFIVLHPLLLTWRLWRDGLGLPPGSILQDYVAPAAKWAVELAAGAFLVFVTYEFKWKFGKKDWWKYVEYLGDAAMVAIFIHSLRLGTNLQHGWYRYVWWFYGLTLVISLADLYYRKYKKIYVPLKKD